MKKRESTLRSGFSLLELMLAVSILLLIVTASAVSLRSRWKGDRVERAAQRAEIAVLKARSRAWREGREWRLAWNPGDSRLRVEPAASPDQGWSLAVDRDLRVSDLDGGMRVAPMHFFADGRAEASAWHLSGEDGEVWTLRLDWDGTPTVERSGMKRDEP